MCCFSRNVKDVSATKIFARYVSASDGLLRQAVVYQMNYKAAEDLAMVLPIPVPPASPENAVTFVNLEKHADFFRRLHKAFPVPRTRAADSGFAPAPPEPSARKLEVHQVGSFEASFVPKIADFARLDERFRLPAGTWEKLPQYGASGFAVFKLRAAATSVHPMAFTFPQAKDARGLFFPAVHIHDGKVHAKATFDHTLYAQQSALRPAQLMNWQESPGLASGVFDSDCGSLVDLKAHVHRRIMVGSFKNEDVLV